jgi:hypothetical protein
MGRYLAILIALCGALGGCVSVDYASLAPGEFRGSVFVMWVGEGNAVGDGNFLFVPDPKDPLRFRRRLASGLGPAIVPLMMYTDGGSIPKLAQVFNGLSPWGYAPGYMIHDWLFTAHHCLVDGDPDPRYAPVRDVAFADSARILGEAIQSLVHQGQVRADDVAATAITLAVGSPIAESQWNAHGVCATERVKPEHIARAEQAVPGSSQFASGPRLAVTHALPRIRTPARIIAHVSF